MTYSRMSIFLTDFITKELNYDEEKKEIIAYSIENIIVQLGGFLLIVAVSFVFEALIPASVAAIFGGLLRKVSGGFHFDSPLKCLFFGTAVYTLIGIFINKYLLFTVFVNYSFLFLILSFVLVFCFAPQDSPAKPIISLSFKRKLKITSLSIMIVSTIIYFVLNSNVLKLSIVLGIFYQSLTLIPILNNKGGVQE
ncbi:MAG: accessory gene regulator ArgB-like protein [Bacillota bacterium]